MEKKPVYFDFVNVADENVFTESKMRGWERQLRDAYVDVLEVIRDKMDKQVPVQFFLNFSLLEESVIDAVIGMKKITNSENNAVESPNSFKVAAYLTYWWLRHKPVSTHFPGNYRIEYVKVKNAGKLGEEEAYDENMKLSWQLKHINEYVAAQFALTYIFDFEKEVCGNKAYKRIKKEEGENITFSGFEEMQAEMFDKFVYYISYRAIAPKMIEHLLEAYTVHPAWGLTGPHWNT